MRDYLTRYADWEVHGKRIIEFLYEIINS